MKYFVKADSDVYLSCVIGSAVMRFKWVPADRMTRKIMYDSQEWTGEAHLSRHDILRAAQRSSNRFVP